MRPTLILMDVAMHTVGAGASEKAKRSRAPATGKAGSRSTRWPRRVGENACLVGFGRIGRAVARTRQRLPDEGRLFRRGACGENIEQELHAEYRDLNTLLAESDYVSVHVPLLEETRGLFNALRFARMKPTAFLINTARGPVVDEAALVHALESGKIAGARWTSSRTNRSSIPG